MPVGSQFFGASRLYPAEFHEQHGAPAGLVQEIREANQELGANLSIHESTTPLKPWGVRRLGHERGLITSGRYRDSFSTDSLPPFQDAKVYGIVEGVGRKPPPLGTDRLRPIPLFVHGFSERTATKVS